MLTRLLFGVGMVVFAVNVLPASSQDKKKGNELNPKDVPLQLALKSAKKDFALDLGGKTAQQFLADLEAALKKGGRIPEPPTIELEIEVKNTGKEQIDFWSAGDPVSIELELKGPGAKTVQAPLAFTTEFRMPKFMSLEPGKSHSFKLTKLVSGFRGASTWHYWTEPGEYTLTARLRTAVRPVPPGAKEIYGGARVTLTTEPIKVNVK